jgi:hypothetical protein
VSKSIAIARASVDAGHRRAARAGVARALAGARVAERPAGRRDEHVARRQRRCHRARRLGAVGGALVHHDQRRVRAGRASLLPERFANGGGAGIDHHDDVLARLDGQAPPNDGPDCGAEIDHAA